jgi:hypothetical protein
MKNILIRSDNLPPITTPPAPPQIRRMFTVTELEPYLRMGQRGVLKEIARGRLISSFCGRKHLVSEASLAAYLKQREGTSPYGKKPATESKETN